MKIYGRLIIYGEYLMDKMYGLIIRSNMYLSRFVDNVYETHPSYNYSKDMVASILERHGVFTQRRLCGNLHFGYGFASSTVLTIIHAYDQLDDESLRLYTKMIDACIHGFTPSGVDTESCLSQNDGLYYDNKWQDIEIVPLQYILFGLKRESEVPLMSIKRKMQKNSDLLINLSNILTKTLVSKKYLDYNIFYKYCKALREINPYSSIAGSFIKDVLGVGLPAKCVGGLHNKAVMVVFNDATVKEKNIVLQIATKYSPHFIVPSDKHLTF